METALTRPRLTCRYPTLLSNTRDDVTALALMKSNCIAQMGSSKPSDLESEQEVVAQACQQAEEAKVAVRTPMTCAGTATIRGQLKTRPRGDASRQNARP